VWTSTDGKHYCTKKHLLNDKAVQSEVEKAKRVSSEIRSLLLLLVLLLHSCTLSFLSFFPLYPKKLQSVKFNAVKCAKVSAAL
jgi:hypothetical protein